MTTILSKRKKIAGITINLGISSAFIILIVISIFSICAIIFIFIRSNLREELRKQIYNSVSVGALLLDGDLHSSLQKPEQEGSQDYQKIKNALKSIREHSLDIYYVYTMRQDEKGNFIFIVDAEDNPQEVSHLGDVYENPTPELKEAFQTKKVVVEKDFAQDDWGVWLSGFAPIFNSQNEFSGILGIDMSAEKIITSERSILLILLGLSGGVFLMILALSLFISRRITRPLRTLEKDMDKITNFQIENKPPIKSAFKEIKSMNLVLENMKAALRSFRKYVPADLVAELIQLHQEAKLDAQKKELTIFFSDIKDFTSFIESQTEEIILEVFAEYFKGMTELILASKGTVDKYIGDAIMAFWNAPRSCPNHALLACYAACESLKFQKSFNWRMKEKGLPEFFTRIGINTGEVLVGNIGFETRLNYTALGDAVNTASRLEGLNKYYHTKILINETTYQLAKEKIVARPVDRVVVKGKKQNIIVYELLSLKAEANLEAEAQANLTFQAFEAYEQKNWAKAVSLYNQLIAKDNTDDLAKLMHKRCLDFQTTPPPLNWNGAIVMRGK